MRRCVLIRRRADHRADADYPAQPGAPYAGAITGGTGKYEGAKGEVRVRTLTGGTKGILTFDLQH